MLIIMFILLIVIVFLSIRLFTMSKEIKNINRQLKAYNNFSTEKKIDISLIDRNIETLGAEVNVLIDHYINTHREKIRSDNELKQAVANISHDLRTPLTSIKGYLQMIESANITETQKREYLNIAVERSKYLENLINDFFELSKIESPDYILNNERINITQHVNEILLSFYNSFVKRNIEPVINIQEEELFIFSDRAAVTRVIENLLTNAIRYSKGDILINVKKHNGYVQVSVENSTELTLEENDLELFFERFYIADKSRTSKSTGLGLSIVKSLMNKMNGEIHSSYDGHNLTFTCVWSSVD